MLSMPTASLTEARLRAPPNRQSIASPAARIALVLALALLTAGPATAGSR